MGEALSEWQLMRRRSSDPSWLQQVYEVYRRFGLNADAESLLTKIRKLGPKANAQLVRTTSTSEIRTEDLRRFVDALIDGNADTAIRCIVVHFIPCRDEAEQQMRSLATQFPTQFLFTKKLQDHQGRPIATIRSIDDDLEGNIVHSIAQGMQFEAVFLRESIAGLVDKFKFTAEGLLDYLYRCPLFREDKRQLLARGLEAYLAHDTAVAIHLLIPQIEDALRNLIQEAGGAVMKPSRSGGFHLRTLDELLRDECLKSVFGDDAQLYFRVLFTDQRGVNLRNDVCHGISPATYLGQGLADRVMHCVLIVAQVRADQSGESAGSESGEPEAVD
jgi:hypothetical protein